MEERINTIINKISKASSRKDRGAIFLELTKSICPICKKNIDAKILEENNKIYLEKRCKVHGYFKVLILSDANWYFNSVKFNKPGSIPLNFNTKVKNGCPSDCGICPDHQQHTCLAILEITNNCNISCNQCFASSGKTGAESHLPVSEVISRLENLIKCEGKAEVLQISGGEPTTHPELIEIIKIAKSMNVQSVMLNTNGINIANDDRLLEKLAEIEPFKPSIYLQFDGFNDDFYKSFRGRPLLDTKLKAIERLSKYNFRINLVATIIQDENENEIGKICEFAINHKSIRSVNFQPVFTEGRSCNEYDPLKHITLTDIFQHAEEQTNGLLLKSDFVPVPCPFPTCSGLTYVFTDEEQSTPITRLIDVEDYLDFFKNRTMLHLSEDIFNSLKSLFSFSVDGGSMGMVQDFCTACGIQLPRIDSISDKVTMIGAMGFMDRYTFDWKRAMKCCIHVLASDKKIIPFCVYNSLYR